MEQVASTSGTRRTDGRQWSPARIAVAFLLCITVEAIIVAGGLVGLFFLEGHYDRLAQSRGLIGGGAEFSRAASVATPVLLAAQAIVPFVVYRLLRPR